MREFGDRVVGILDGVGCLGERGPMAGMVGIGEGLGSSNRMIHDAGFECLILTTHVQ